MRFLMEYFPEFAKELEKIDDIHKEKSSMDEKTKQLLCFALAIKNRSRPCLIKHFKGSLKAGATLRDISEVMALTFRESTGEDDCWTHDALGDFRKVMRESVECCPK